MYVGNECVGMYECIYMCVHVIIYLFHILLLLLSLQLLLILLYYYYHYDYYLLTIIIIIIISKLSNLWWAVKIARDGGIQLTYTLPLPMFGARPPYGQYAHPFGQSVRARCVQVSQCPLLSGVVMNTCNLAMTPRNEW